MNFLVSIYDEEISYKLIHISYIVRVKVTIPYLFRRQSLLLSIIKSCAVQTGLNKYQDIEQVIICLISEIHVFLTHSEDRI